MTQSSIKRNFIAIAAALVMSSVTVGAAIGPAQAATTPAHVALHA